MSEWPATKAQRVLAALYRIGSRQKRRSASHLVLARAGSPDFFFASHGRRQARRARPRMLARIAKATGLRPEDL